MQPMPSMSILHTIQYKTKYRQFTDLYTLQYYREVIEAITGVFQFFTV